MIYGRVCVWTEKRITHVYLRFAYPFNLLRWHVYPIADRCGSASDESALCCPHGHNTVAGLPEFLEAARGTSLEAIPGVEISTGYLGKEVHIVGLFLEQEKYGPLEVFLGVINRRKEESNRALVAALYKPGTN
mgnify:CR=1 FL=1